MALNEQWFQSFLFAELLLVVFVILTFGVAYLLEKHVCEAIVSRSMLGAFALVLNVFLRLTYENSGSPLCIGQQFVHDQLTIVALGFILSGYRHRLSASNRYHPLLFLLILSYLSCVFHILWWLGLILHMKGGK